MTVPAPRTDYEEWRRKCAAEEEALVRKNKERQADRHRETTDWGPTGIDWAGLSYRRLRGWLRGARCLSRCGEGHVYNSRWCAWRIGR